ncbi:muscarinic acetylcholine receptor M4-like [Lytechinus variegatus]|uniref:muscarinic acetylcholine receptor M4-like n=1 Tax=Lytechinus variegatus TaxID=7654 RepID=UPI001BB10632|nr:muscarinic acetylcholine receptor M4-like [Lytechinus variegatus]
MNNSSPRTNNHSDYDFVLESYPQRIIIACIHCIIIAVGIIGNSHVVLAVLLCRKLRSSTNWLVVNLGMADLLNCLFLPFNVVALLTKDGWPIGEWICAMTGVVTMTCLGASIVSLALIAHNRLTLLTKPRFTFYRFYSNRNLIVMVILSWLYPLLLVIIPPIVGLGVLGYSENYKVCLQDTTLPNSDYYSLIAGVGVIVPASIIIVIIYVLIYRYVSRHNKAFERRLAESSKAGSSKFTPTSLDMSTNWTESRDHQQTNEDVAGSSRLNCEKFGNAGNGSTFTDSSHINNQNDTSNLSSTGNLTESDDAERQNNPSDNPCKTNEDEIESKVKSQAEDRASTSDDRISQANLENKESSNPRRDFQTPERTDDLKPSPKISRHNINVTKRLFLVVISFFLCFLPFGICVMVPTSDPAVPWANLLVMLNSCINPILYAGTMPLFRKVMWCIARCRYHSIPEPVDLVRFCRRHQL